ncbi:MAG: IS110 family transposase [Acidobacteriota bacterium]|nr:IS110 family transposase [Acidobacteriota bacterium]
MSDFRCVELGPLSSHTTVRPERLAWQLLGDLERIDGQRRETKKHMDLAVAASGTTVTEVYGVGAFVACAVIGHVVDINRFASRAAFAAYNGTAPVEVSSGEKKIYRLSRRGNRRLIHLIHMAAVTQIRFAGTPGRIYYERKRAEGKGGKEAIRALKRRISDLIYARLVADAKAAGNWKWGPGGQTGNDSESSVTGSHPATPALRKSHSRTTPTLRPAPAGPPEKSSPDPLDTKRHSDTSGCVDASTPDGARQNILSMRHVSTAHDLGTTR